MTLSERGDTPTKRVEFIDMPADQQEQFIAALQERRLAGVKRYEAAQALQHVAATERLQVKVQKHLAKIGKLLATAEKTMAKAELALAETRALELQLKDEGT